MAIKFGKWVRGSGEHKQRLAEVRISFFLTREELAGALIAYDPPVEYADLEKFAKISNAEAERRIRHTLEDSAVKMHYYGDHFNGFAEVSQDEAEEAAYVIIDRLLGR